MGRMSCWKKPNVDKSYVEAKRLAEKHKQPVLFATIKNCGYDESQKSVMSIKKPYKFDSREGELVHKYDNDKRVYAYGTPCCATGYAYVPGSSR